ncbi:MAG: Hsp33 family molecular chaperone HslO [Clostridia bacterium]|nr:Hsp33 family molecular chaperone HslO [Clostridia bacterium]
MNRKSTMLRGTLGKGMVRFFAIDSTDMVIEMKNTHKTSYTATVALGRMITAGALMSGILKNDQDAVTISINGGGPAGTMVCTAFKKGLVKGYMNNGRSEIPPKDDGSFDVGGFVGTNGRISIMRSMGYGQPYTGQCELQTGEIASDLAYYFLKSEQISSLVALGVSLDKDGNVSKAGGIILQVMPGCSDDIIENLEIRSMMMSDISRQLEAMDLKDFIFALFYDLDINLTETTHPYYGCDCSEEKIEKVLLSMGEMELQNLADTQENTEITCHFCGKEYSFSSDEIKKLIKTGK